MAPRVDVHSLPSHPAARFAALLVACALGPGCGDARSPGTPIDGPDGVDTGGGDTAPSGDASDGGTDTADASADTIDAEDVGPDAPTPDAGDTSDAPDLADPEDVGDAFDGEDAGDAREDGSTDGSMDVPADAVDLETDPLPDAVDDAASDADGESDVPDVRPEPLASTLFEITVGAGSVTPISFAARAGERVVVTAASRDGAPTEIELALVGPEGRDPIARSDEAFAAPARLPPTGHVTLPVDGAYRVDVLHAGEGADLVVVVACTGGACVDVIEHDRDADLVQDRDDNCVDRFNPLQQDSDGDGLGDACPPTPVGEGLTGSALALALRAEWEATHVGLGYDRARDWLFNEIYWDEGEVECTYTGVRAAIDRSRARPDGSLMNTEHLWPQSLGAGSEPARSDLHHLAPTETTVNSRRGARPFCEATDVTWEGGGSKVGTDREALGIVCFEPREQEQGRVARAMLYFSVIYGNAIDPFQSRWFRDWHARYPPTPEERRRNHLIRAVQGSRNPFIDFPELVGRLP